MRLYAIIDEHHLIVSRTGYLRVICEAGTVTAIEFVAVPGFNFNVPRGRNNGLALGQVAHGTAEVGG